MERDFIITGINRVVLVGKEEYPEKNSSFGHHLKHNEIIFHFSGQSTVYFGDTVLKIKPNTVRFLPEGEAMRYDVVREEAGECIFAAFYADRPLSDKAFVLDVTKKAHVLGHLFKKMFACWVSKEEGYYFKCISILYDIFAELQRERYVPSPHFERIRDAVDYIQKHFLAEEISIPALAARAGISESYLKRLFKEKYGVPPKKYILQLKINYASDLLRMNHYTVTQVAQMCGFADVYFFSRQFKEYTGLSPLQFAKKYRSSR